MGKGLRKEGCREEGDLSGYIASGEHVTLRVWTGLGDGVSRLSTAPCGARFLLLGPSSGG